MRFELRPPNLAHRRAWQRMTFFIGLLILVCVCAGAQSGVESSQKIELPFNRLPPTQGQMIKFVKTHYNLGRFKYGHSEWQTNVLERSEISGKSQVVEWDDTNCTSRVRYSLDKVVYGNLKATNDVALGSNSIVARSILGTVFVSAEEMELQAEVRRILEIATMVLYPFRDWIPDGEAIGVNTARTPGENWVVNLSEGKNLDRLKKFLPDSAPIAKNAIFEVSFKGITNYSKLNCFRLSIVARMTTNSLPEKQLLKAVAAGMKNINGNGRLEYDMIIPFDAKMPVLLQSVTVDGEYSFEAWVSEANANLTMQMSIHSESLIQREPALGFDR
jgi:hypothetical protein